MTVTVEDDEGCRRFLLVELLRAVGDDDVGGCCCVGSCEAPVDEVGAFSSAATILSTQTRDSISFHLLIAEVMMSFSRSVVVPARCLIPSLLDPRAIRSRASVWASWLLVDSHSVGLCWNSELRRFGGALLDDGEKGLNVAVVVVDDDGVCPIPTTAPSTKWKRT